MIDDKRDMVSDLDHGRVTTNGLVICSIALGK